MSSNRIIVVANRLPVTISKNEEDVCYKASPGGLVTALSSLKDKYEQLWIGWPGEVDLEQISEEAVRAKLKEEFNAIPIFLTKQQLNRYYFGFSNKVVWPIVHYLPSHCDYDERDWRAYKEVNQIFADAILNATDESSDDIIWIHDYQLLLVPALVRQKRPHARIGFFLHTPFPSSEIFRALPYRDELLRGMLGADLIGFHTYGYLRHFRSSLLRILAINSEINRVDLETHSAKLGVYPISIDTNKIQETVASKAVAEYVKTVQNITHGRKLIISVDRLDYTKGIANRLKGFKKFLERNPRMAPNVVLVQIAVPSRTQISSYRGVKDDVEAIVSEINEQHENLKYPPIHYIYRSLPFDKLCAFYKQAEVCLVTPLCDGMNLVAKEYVAVQKDRGVLVLSEFAGATSELGEAIVVNPWDPDEIGEAIETAFNLPIWDRSRRMGALYNKVLRNTVHDWSNAFLNDLSSKLPNPTNIASATTYVDEKVRNEILEKYKNASSALLIFDYDGTLVEFTNVPMNAKPDRNLLNLLTKLEAKAGTDVLIATGRGKHDIADWFAEHDLGLSVEHGLWVKWTGELEWQKMIPEDQTPDWYPSVREIFTQFSRGTPGSFIEEKETAIAWHYRMADPEYGSWQARELTVNLTNFLANKPAEVLHGKNIIEVRIAGVNKGNLFARMQQLGKKYDFILAIGDDMTDEDIFAVMPEYGYTIKVGKNLSKAKYRLNNVNEVRNFLSKFI